MNSVDTRVKYIENAFESGVYKVLKWQSERRAQQITAALEFIFEHKMNLAVKYSQLETCNEGESMQALLHEVTNLQQQLQSKEQMLAFLRKDRVENESASFSL